MLIEYEQMDLEGYKQSIQGELEYEELLYKRIDEDQNIKNKVFVKNRIQTRINIIKDELNQQVENVEDGEANAQVPIENVEVSTNQVSVEKVDESKSQEKIIDSKNTQIKEEKIEIKKLEIKDKKLYQETKLKAEEYKQAVEYFLQIESMKQADDAREKARILNDAIIKMEEGKTVDEFSLPISITPDYICNMSKQERLNNFSVIIKDFSAKKNELNQKLEKAINGFKGIDKKIFVKNVN
jgi:hypothetical protein